jgi:hypothetical protein
MSLQHEAEIIEKLMPSMPTEKPSMLRNFFSIISVILTAESPMKLY